jgi:hypothetical protein
MGSVQVHGSSTGRAGCCGLELPSDDVAGALGRAKAGPLQSPENPGRLTRRSVDRRRGSAYSGGMSTGIGEQQLGDFARSQFAAARRDPRLERKRGAMIADFKVAMDEAERVRTLGVSGLHELTLTVERHERQLGVSCDDESLAPNVARTLQAAWERAESARIEIANGHPHLNAQALVSMNSALDALVEEWMPSLRAMRARWMAEQAIKKTNEESPQPLGAVAPELRQGVADALRLEVERKLGKVDKLKNKGVNRYESLLAQEGLAVPPDRPIPEDLDVALTEVGALRDVLIHRAGRVDPKALEQAPALRYHDGELVRISCEEYRIYSAAIRCYATEIQLRPMRNWPELTDEHLPALADWRSYYILGA